MNFELSTYKNKPAIYDKSSKSFVLFGSKKTLEYRLKDLNNHFLKEGQSVRIIDQQDEHGKYNRIFKITGIIQNKFYVVNEGSNELTYLRSQLHLL